MLKILGSILVLVSAGGFGFCKTMRFYKQVRLLRSFKNALELLKCEMNYTLMPVPKLCRLIAARTDKAVCRFLRRYADGLETEGMTREKAAARAMEEGIDLPNDAQMALLELFGSLGRYDLSGENQLLQLTAHRLGAALERFDREKRPMAKGYAVLGVCTGMALVILFI